MNTMTVIFLLIAALVAVGVLLWIFKMLIEQREPRNRKFILIGLLLYILGLVLLVISALNVYGIARLPVLNEVNKRAPETYVAPERVEPPTQGSTQPSSQPTIDDHKARMDKLKKDGF